MKTLTTKLMAKKMNFWTTHRSTEIALHNLEGIVKAAPINSGLMMDVYVFLNSMLNHLATELKAPQLNDYKIGFVATRSKTEALKNLEYSAELSGDKAAVLNATFMICTNTMHKVADQVEAM